MAQVLLTNDDGIDAPGLRALLRSVTARGLSTVVVAPATNQSGVARATTYRRPVAVTRRDDVDGARLFACEGFPVDCVRVAVLSQIAADVQVVVSGVNHGPNLGDDARISGTVGAAAEAALLGVPAVAVSDQIHSANRHVLDPLDHGNPDYADSALVGGMFAEAAIENEAPPRAMLNVNIPAAREARTVAVTRLGKRFYKRGSLELKGGVTAGDLMTYGEPGSPAPKFEDAPGTDFGAIVRGRISATPLGLDWSRADASRTTREWVEAVAAKVEVALQAEPSGASLGSLGAPGSPKTTELRSIALV